MKSSMIVAFALLGLLPSPARAVAQGDAVPDSATIRTTGTAQRSMPPDLATFTVQFSATARSPRVAGQWLAVRADSVRDALVSLGIPRDSLATRSRWQWWRGRVAKEPAHRCERDLPTQACRTVFDSIYRAHEGISVRLRDMSLIGPAIDTLLALGITDISGLSFTATETLDLRGVVVREATVRAREQAELMAEALGGRLGRLVSLSTEPGASRNPYGFDQIVVTGAGGAQTARTEIVVPSVTLRSTIYGSWRFIEP